MQIFFLTKKFFSYRLREFKKYETKNYFLQIFIDLLSVAMKKTADLFPNKPLVLRVCNTSLLKTLWEKEKLLVTSNFSFSHIVFFFPLGKLSAIFILFKIVVCKPFQFGRVKNVWFGKGLMDLGPVSISILKNILCLFFQDFVNLKKKHF